MTLTNASLETETTRGASLIYYSIVVRIVEAEKD